MIRRDDWILIVTTAVVWLVMYFVAAPAFWPGSDTFLRVRANDLLVEAVSFVLLCGAKAFAILVGSVPIAGIHPKTADPPPRRVRGADIAASAFVFLALYLGLLHVEGMVLYIGMPDRWTAGQTMLKAVQIALHVFMCWFLVAFVRRHVRARMTGTFPGKQPTSTQNGSDTGPSTAEGGTS